jgi:hypothetical protein
MTIMTSLSDSQSNGSGKDGGAGTHHPNGPAGKLEAHSYGMSPRTMR